MLEEAGSGEEESKRLKSEDELEEFVYNGESPSPLYRSRHTLVWPPIMEMALTVAICAGFMIVGPVLIMSNKYLLTKSGFGYPLLLTALHQLSSAFFCMVLVRGCAVVQLKQKISWSFWCRSIMLVGLATTGALCFGNSAYMYLTVSFIEILKGFTPIVTMMVQTMGGEPMPTCRIASVVLMISMGTAVSSFGELRMDFMGLGLMLASVYCEATRLMLTQRLLQHKNFHVLEGLYYISPASAICSLLIAAVMELHSLDSRAVIASLPSTWPLYATNMLLGFLVNVASFLVIKRTSVVMLKLLAIARNALVVIAGVLLFEDAVSRVQAAGYAISLTCFALYNYMLFTSALPADSRSSGGR